MIVHCARQRLKQFLLRQSERLAEFRCPTRVFVASESVAAQIAGPHPADNFTALQLQIHDDLRSQHPEWVQPNGDCPICDFYEERLAQLLEGYATTGSVESAAAIHLALQDAATKNLAI